MSTAISTLQAPSIHYPTFAINPIQETERAASQLRTLLMGLPPAARPRNWNWPARPSVSTLGLVDVRRVARRVQVLPAPPWSAPTERFWTRPEVAGRLEAAAHALPAGYSLGFWEGLRPVSIQSSLWQTGLQLMAAMYPALDGTLLEDTLETFIARPTPHAPHAQGRAVDVAILDASGRVLEEREHLHVLSSVLNDAGLSNYEPEWWHWSYDAGNA